MDKETLLTEFRKRLGEPNATGHLGDTGITTRTLYAYINAIFPLVSSEESVNDDFLQSHLSVIKAMGGQMRYEQADFVKNYKPKSNNKEVVEDPLRKEDNELVSQLLSRIESIENENKVFRKNSEINSLRDVIRKKAGDLKVANKNLWDDAVSMVEYKDGMDSELMEAETKKIYESKLKSYMGDGAFPYGGSDSKISEENEKALDDFFAKMANEGKFPKP